MSEHDQELDKDHEHHRSDRSAPSSDEGVGRQSRSSRLARPRRPIPSGIVAPQQRIMRKAAGAAGDQAAMKLALQKAEGSSSQGLPSDLRAMFEGSTGADLGGVRIHTGAESADAARAVGAKAYAVGQDVHFAAGQYQPNTKEGQQLIAHEVFHTLQAPQKASGDSVEVSESHDAAEVEADRGAEAMVRGESAVAPTAASGAVVHRKPDGSTNSYSAQQGLKWSNGTALTEEEMTQWASARTQLATSAASYVAKAAGVKASPGDLIKKLEKEARAEVEGDILTREREIAHLESELENAESKTGYFKKINPMASIRASQLKARIKTLEAQLEHVQDGAESRIAAAAKQHIAIVQAISKFANSALSTASALNSAVNGVSPDQFADYGSAFKTIDKACSAANMAVNLLDTTALNRFKQNPNYENACAWAQQVGKVFKDAGAFTDVFPAPLGPVFEGIFAMPGIVTNQFIGVINKRYAALDAEVRDGNGSKVLKEGTSG